MELLNTVVGLVSLFLGGFAIWLSLQFYDKAKESEKATATALAEIKAQSGALERLTGRWMDRLTRHATAPRPTDEGMLQLVQAVANMPTMLLTHLQVVRAPQDQAATQALLRETVMAYIAIYFYSAQANVLAQILAPLEEQFNAEDESHVRIKSLVDQSFADFNTMANLLQRTDQALIQASPLRHLLDQAMQQWRPNVRDLNGWYEVQRQQRAAG